MHACIYLSIHTSATVPWHEVECTAAAVPRTHNCAAAAAAVAKTLDSQGPGHPVSQVLPGISRSS
eukprot:683430-Pyramimonas_sp.AAC.1